MIKNKRKLLLLILLVVFTVCAFAFSASAADADITLTAYNSVLTFTPVSGADYYVVRGYSYGTTISDSTGTLLKTVTDTGHNSYAMYYTDFDNLSAFKTMLSSGSVTFRVYAYKDGRITLSVPVLTISGNTASWSAVEHADKYGVLITASSGETVVSATVTDTSYDLSGLAAGTYNVSVGSASLDIDNYLPSDFCAPVQYSKNVQLAAPANIAISGSVISWSNVENNSGYEVIYRRVDGDGSIYQTDSVAQNITQHTVSVTTGGEYSISVIALGTGYYTDSDESACVNYTLSGDKCETPTLTFESGKLTVTAFGDSSYRFDVYIDDVYYCTLKKSSGGLSGGVVASDSASTTLSTSLTASNFDLGTHSITAKSTSTSSDVADSDMSAPVYFTVYSVTNTLSHCGTSNTYTKIFDDAYNATLTADLGYIFSDGSYQMSIGGVDVTSSFMTVSRYNKTISISVPAESVTGNIVISYSGTYDLANIVKGDVINADLDGDGTTELYRVINIDGTVAEILGLYGARGGKFGSSSTYENSYVDTYLNVTWYNKLTDTVKAAIVDKTFTRQGWSDSVQPYFTNQIPISSYTCYSKYIYAFGYYDEYSFHLFDDSYGEELTRHVYLLGVQDIVDYVTDTNVTDGLISLSNICYMVNNLSDMYQRGFFPTRDLSYCSDGYICCVEASGSGSVDGELGSYGYNEYFDAAPALTIDLSKIDFS